LENWVRASTTDQRLVWRAQLILAAAAGATSTALAQRFRVRPATVSQWRRRELLDFMNEAVADYPQREIHVILDNLSTHKPKRDRWRARHPNVHWHYTPTHASWLNQIEIWFSILTRQALRGASFTSPHQVREAIDRSLVAYHAQAAPFEWRKRQVQSVGLKQYYADLRH
jgi:hypothetical protein